MFEVLNTIESVKTILWPIEVEHIPRKSITSWLKQMIEEATSTVRYIRWMFSHSDACQISTSIKYKDTESNIDI